MTTHENWVDYRQIKEQVSIQMVLDKYGVKTKKSGKNHVSCCPIHDGTDPRQFSVNLEKGIWQCFGECRAGGNILDLTAMMEFGNKEPSSIRRAGLRLKDWFMDERPEVDKKQEGLVVEEKAPPTERQEATGKPMQPINVPLKFELKNLDPNNDWFENYGLLPETVRYFGLGLQKKGRLIPNRIAIPIHDHLGQLVAYCGRATGSKQIQAEGKYKYPDNFTRSEVVYNLNRQQEDVNTLILVESFISVWKLHQLGFPNTVALMGNRLTGTQENLIVDFLGPNKQVVILFNAETQYKGCIDDCLTSLSRRLFVKLIDISPYAKKPHQITSGNIHACLCQ
jgi:hypothetical protein